MPLSVPGSSCSGTWPWPLPDSTTVTGTPGRKRRMAFSSLTTSAATRGEGPSVTSTTPGRPTAR